MSRGDYDLGPNDLVMIRFDRVEFETDDAYGLEVVPDGETVWLPKSQTVSLDPVRKEAYVPKWLADDKELDFE